MSEGTRREAWIIDVVRSPGPSHAATALDARWSLDTPGVTRHCSCCSRQGISANLTSFDGDTREECDQRAVESQARSHTAITDGRFDRPLVPIRHDDGSIALDHEELPRSGTRLGDLAKLSPSFATMGSQRAVGRDRTVDKTAPLACPQLDAISSVHHAGNAQGIVDGAGAALTSSDEHDPTTAPVTMCTGGGMGTIIERI